MCGSHFQNLTNKNCISIIIITNNYVSKFILRLSIKQGSRAFIFMVMFNRVPTPENRVNFCNNLLGTLNAMSSTIILFCIHYSAGRRDSRVQLSWQTKRVQRPAPWPHPALRTRTQSPTLRDRSNKPYTRSMKLSCCHCCILSIVRCRYRVRYTDTL